MNRRGKDWRDKGMLGENNKGCMPHLLLEWQVELDFSCRRLTSLGAHKHLLILEIMHRHFGLDLLLPDLCGMFAPLSIIRLRFLGFSPW